MVSYHILDGGGGGDVLKPFVIKSNFNIENLNSKDIKARFSPRITSRIVGQGLCSQ